MGTISPRVLNITPRPGRANTVRFPGRLAGKTSERSQLSFVTPAPKSLSAFVTPTPKSFSDIFSQTHAPLDVNFEKLKETSTKATALATLRAILDHVEKKKNKFESYDDYEYYDYEYEYVDTADKTFTQVKTIDKPRPKIIPKQRVVPKLDKKRKNSKKFSSFVTQKPRTIGEILGTVQEKTKTRYGPLETF